MGASSDWLPAPRQLEFGFTDNTETPDPRLKGLKPRQRDIALEIKRLGRCTLRQVASNLALSTNGVSQTYGTLDRRGLITIAEKAPPKKGILDAIISWVPYQPR